MPEKQARTATKYNQLILLSEWLVVAIRFIVKINLFTNNVTLS